MGNDEIDSNGRREMQEPVTMKILQREVQSYRVDDEKIMKAREEIIQRLNMLHKKFNK